MLELRNFLGQLEKIGAIEPKRLDRRAATNGGSARSAFDQRGFAETVARLESGERRFRSPFWSFFTTRARPETRT